MTKLATRSLACLAVAAVAALAYTQRTSATPPETPCGGRPFTVDLTGSAEAPGPGDPDGSGTASLRLNPGTEQVCFDITVADSSATIAGAHIHEAPAGSPGPVVINFNTAANGLDGCVSADRELILEIFRDPAEYYVNVHADEFPAGAVRGQLR